MQPPRKLHILIVEDDDELRAIVVRLLQAAGHTTTECGDGEDVLRTLESRSVDLVITDLVMPKQEGIETIMAVRREFPRLPIIAMSGGSFGDAYLALARRLGADCVMEKPFTAATLTRTISHALRAPEHKC